MPAPHSTDNYSIGKGKLYIGSWSGSTPPSDPSGFSEMGNCPSIEIEPTLERLPHYSSRSGLRNKDKNPVIQTEYALSITCDEIAAVNLNKFLLGTLVGEGIIQGLNNTDAEFALKFVSDNPIGPNQTWKFHRVTLSPGGALSLIGDEWMTMSFNGEGLADVANNASSPYFTVTYSTETTTTTTTTVTGPP